jgi:TRAP-type C4-dicarboxylate transport system permease small subunit
MTEETQTSTSRRGKIASGIEYALAIGLIVAILFNFINVVGRYVTGVTLTGVDELEVYLLIWIAFLNAAVVSWHGQHLRMDLLLAAVSPSARRAVSFFETAVTILVTSFIAYQSFLYVMRIFQLGAVSDIARIPTWIPHSAVCLGFALIALIAIDRGVALLRPPRVDPL